MDITEENGNSFQFDYSPWQRTEKKLGSPKNLLTIPGLAQAPGQKYISFKPSHVSVTRKSPLSSGHGSTTVPESLFPDLRKECSSLCRHGPRIKTPEVSLPEKRKSKDGSIALLKLLIKERRLALESNKQRYMKLIRENMKLKEEISSFEDVSHTEVKELLSKYKKYQGALSVLSSTHSTSLKHEELELHKTQEKIHRMLQVLRNDSKELDKEIEKEKHALKVLHNYKEKEYPDKLEQMKRLQYEIDMAEAEFVAAMTELQGISDIEKVTYVASAEIMQGDMISDLATTTLLTMNGSVKDMARQNVLIKQEIDFHRSELERHQKEIDRLEVEVRELKEEEKTMYTRRKHPEKFLETCFPETEFELRIPKQRYLPL